MTGVIAGVGATIAAMSAAEIAATAIAVVGAGVGAAQQASAADDQAKAARYQADYQNQVAQYNATVAKNQADVANQETNSQEELHRRRVAQIQGEAMASIAQSNTGFGGTNADILKQNAINAELDALNIRYEGQNRANGFLAQSQLDQYGGQQALAMGDITAKNAQSAGKWNAATSLLSGLGTAAYYGKGASSVAKAG